MEDVGLAVTTAPEVLDKPVAGDQEYVTPFRNVMVQPVKIPASGCVSSLTIKLQLPLAVQPFNSVSDCSGVYVPVNGGDAEVIGVPELEKQVFT